MEIFAPAHTLSQQLSIEGKVALCGACVQVGKFGCFFRQVLPSPVHKTRVVTPSGSPILHFAIAGLIKWEHRQAVNFLISSIFSRRSGRPNTANNAENCPLSFPWPGASEAQRKHGELAEKTFRSKIFRRISFARVANSADFCGSYQVGKGVCDAPRRERMLDDRSVRL